MFAAMPGLWSILRDLLMIKNKNAGVGDTKGGMGLSKVPSFVKTTGTSAEKTENPNF